MQILHGASFPEMLTPDHPQINMTYVLPDEALAEVVIPTARQLEESPHAWMARGVELFAAREYAQAASVFRACLARQNDFPDARHNLGVALAEVGKYPEALEFFRLARDKEPDRSEVHMGEARFKTLPRQTKAR